MLASYSLTQGCSEADEKCPVSSPTCNATLGPLATSSWQTLSLCSTKQVIEDKSCLLLVFLQFIDVLVIGSSSCKIIGPTSRVEDPWCLGWVELRGELSS